MTASLFVVETDTNHYLGRLDLSVDRSLVRIVTGMPGRPAILRREDITGIVLARFHPDCQEVS